MLERMAVGLLHRHPRARRPDVREEQRRADLRAELTQVLVAPAGSELQGVSLSPYQPRPNPSALAMLTSGPLRRLCSISDRRSL
jgi:hypothetical protein